MNILGVHFGVAHILLWVETPTPVMVVRAFVPGDIYSGINRKKEKSTHVNTIQRSQVDHKTRKQAKFGMVFQYLEHASNASNHSLECPLKFV